MRTTLPLALTLSIACHTDAPAPTAPPQLSEANAPASLFDGRSLAGWDGDPRFWRVENGCIVGESTAANPCDATTYLTWRGGTLEDFELSFEYRIVGGNSGVQFRSESRDGWQIAGFQADIEDGPNWTGCLYEQDGAGVVATRGESVELDGAGARKTRFDDAAQLLANVRMREWNEYTIRARGEQVELSVNGRVTAKVRDQRPQRRLAGVLALQLHAGPSMKVEYRELRLVKLPTSDAAPVVLAPKPEGPAKRVLAQVRRSAAVVAVGERRLRGRRCGRARTPFRDVQRGQQSVAARQRRQSSASVPERRARARSRRMVAGGRGRRRGAGARGREHARRAVQERGRARGRLV
jgi:hypothetical protein